MPSYGGDKGECNRFEVNGEQREASFFKHFCNFFNKKRSLQEDVNAKVDEALKIFYASRSKCYFRSIAECMKRFIRNSIVDLERKHKVEGCLGVIRLALMRRSVEGFVRGMSGMARS